MSYIRRDIDPFKGSAIFGRSQYYNSITPFVYTQRAQTGNCLPAATDTISTSTPSVETPKNRKRKREKKHSECKKAKDQSESSSSGSESFSDESESDEELDKHCTLAITKAGLNKKIKERKSEKRSTKKKGKQEYSIAESNKIAKKQKVQYNDIFS